MRLESLIHRVESGLFAMGRRLFDADGRAEVRDEISEAEAEQARWRAELDEVTARRDELVRRIGDHETAAALLPSQIENSLRRGKHAQSVRQALELDRIRRELAADRAELPRLEQRRWSIAFHLRQLARHIDRLRANNQSRRR